MPYGVSQVRWDQIGYDEQRDVTARWRRRRELRMRHLRRLTAGFITVAVLTVLGATAYAVVTYSSTALLVGVSILGLAVTFCAIYGIGWVAIRASVALQNRGKQ